MSILNIKKEVEGQNLDRIETETIKPIQIDENSCTFVFRNKGMLDRNTTIVLPVVGADANQKLPLSAGIMSFVKYASLNIGGQELASTDEVGSYYAMRCLFKPQEVRNNIEMVNKGVMNVYEQNTRSNIPDTPAGKVRIGGDGLTYGGAENDTGTTNPMFTITDDVSTTPHFTFTLEDLFPHLFSALQLPLMYIRDEVSLKIQWSSNDLNKRDNERVVATENNNMTGATIVKDQVVMLVDYLFYNDTSSVAKEIMSDQGMILQYGDVITNKMSLPALGAAPAPGQKQRKDYNLNIGMTNRVVRSLYFGREPVPNANTSYKNQIFNKYCSFIGSRADKGESLQVKINDQPLFQSPMVADGQKYSALEETFGMPLNVPLCMYSHYGSYHDGLSGGVLYNSWTENCNVAADTIYGVPQTSIVGGHHYMGVNLHKPILQNGMLIRSDSPNSGVLITSSPINIQYSRDISTDNENSILNVWAVVEKQSVLKMGQFVTTNV